MKYSISQMSLVRGFVSVVLMMAVLAGCQQAGPADGQQAMGDPLKLAAGADLQRNTEVQLVEQMAQYRAKYREHLVVLKQFYDQQGNQLKSDWAAQELKELDLLPQREYLVIAEVSGPELRAFESIVAADVLYQDAIKQVKDGRGIMATVLVDKKKLAGAVDMFNSLITNYPTSDKIDDAAFQVGELYRHYLNDPTRALLYYQRVWQWDPQTTLPARYAVARIYDDVMHDRIKALQFYEMVISLESGYPENVVYAQSRIAKISKKLFGD